MVKVITYGTYDLLHYGHIKLLERAKALGDYLIVGVTADDFDKVRGKINVQQSLSERIEAIRKTGIADEIIAEEYEGQKIDDIIKYEIDIFTVGSDWEGYFDYLQEFCKVVYLPRTEGISSSEIREKKRALKIGLVGNSEYLNKVVAESQYVNGIMLSGVCTSYRERLSEKVLGLPIVTDSYDKLIESSDAVYIHSIPEKHYEQVRFALQQKRHVLCESPLAMNVKECKELYELAKDNNTILVESLRTVHATAFHRLLLLVKSGKIGDVVSIDAVCTSIKSPEEMAQYKLTDTWNSMTAWGPTALLPIFSVLGTEYDSCRIMTRFIDSHNDYDDFTKTIVEYPHAIATIQVGNGVKSEGELIISGTKGYVYVPAPWWKTDYFELRYENPIDNKRFFYQLDGEGIRNELADFAKSVSRDSQSMYISEKLSMAIAKVMELFVSRTNMKIL